MKRNSFKCSTYCTYDFYIILAWYDIERIDTEEDCMHSLVVVVWCMLSWSVRIDFFSKAIFQSKRDIVFLCIFLRMMLHLHTENFYQTTMGWNPF